MSASELPDSLCLDDCECERLYCSACLRVVVEHNGLSYVPSRVRVMMSDDTSPSYGGLGALAVMVVRWARPCLSGLVDVHRGELVDTNEPDDPGEDDDGAAGVPVSVS